MKNLLILINGVLNGQIVVNSKSEESAREIYEHFNGPQGDSLTFEEVDINVPQMFSNCILNSNQFI